MKSKRKVDFHPAPSFSLPAFLPDGSEKKIQLSAMKGQGLILFFYPRDNTPGCTNEATAFSHAHEEIQSIGYEVLGISTDSIESHRKFSNKLSLPFPLLTDEGGSIATKYGCYKLKKMYGKEFMGIERSTFLIDSASNIIATWRKVKVPGHVEEVIKKIKL